jgi:hypothetical protein
MVALQEELDWDVYGSYGLLSADERPRLTTSPDFELPALKPGERAFEIEPWEWPPGTFVQVIAMR